MKRIHLVQCTILWITMILSTVCFAANECPSAVANTKSGFCSSFKTSAICHCTAKGVPHFLCGNMQSMYSRMIFVYGSLQKVCSSQSETSPQHCIDDWNCYLKGGKNSLGKRCNSTGHPCEQSQ